ncbi:MAG: hypothetical protein IKF52_01535, partial [Clostridia bacterium]|nr:hypothetical protein [Clostridia bacterium]
YVFHIFNEIYNFEAWQGVSQFSSENCGIAERPQPKLKKYIFHNLNYVKKAHGFLHIIKNHRLSLYV